MKVLLVFVDGIGMGENRSDKNPFVAYPVPLLQTLFGGSPTLALGPVLSEHACLIPTDATLGVAGLPQSATGQTALFTGVNAPAVMGMHVHAFPGPKLTEIIAEHGIMKRLTSHGYRVTSANMYTPDYMTLVASRKRRHAATTLTILTAGQPLRSLEDLLAGRAIYQDITNEALIQAGWPDVVPLAPRLAGQGLVELADTQDFTMFEYFQTDLCGHKQDWVRAARIMNILQEFLAGIYEALPPDMLFVLTSDHGNFEDLSTKRHTLQPVPTVLIGRQCVRLARNIHSLADITPVIISALETDRGR